MAMMMTIALRFIPTLTEEADKIMKAQSARGADFTSGNLKQRATAMIPLLVPLFVSAFRRAGDLAMAMESRCYHGGEGRTRLHVLKYRMADFMALAAVALLIALTIAAQPVVTMRVLLTLEYDGTDYVGWQWQENGLSVQQVLEHALSRVLG